MNTYFDTFNMEETFYPDIKKLTSTYFELSRKFHPDYYLNSPIEIQEEMLTNSAQLNKAFQTLKNTDSTLWYMLFINNLITNDEKYTLPKDFLFQMLELNEEIDEANNKQIFIAKITELEEEAFLNVKDLMLLYNKKTTTNLEWEKIKEYYFKKKYLDRLKYQIQ